MVLVSGSCRWLLSMVIFIGGCCWLVVGGGCQGLLLVVVEGVVVSIVKTPT